MVESDELQNIRISVDADETLDKLIENEFFEDAISAYRAAICIAISLDLSPDTNTSTPRNKWDTAAVFRSPNANVEDILLLMGIPRGEVVTRGRQLAEAGLRYIEAKMTANVDLWSILIPSALSEGPKEDWEHDPSETDVTAEESND